jgi:mercuric ion transport protein
MSVASPALAIAKPVAGPRSIARLTYRYAARLYVVAVAAQVALAGVFVFVGPQTIELHKTFAHTFLVLSSVLLLSALLGRLPAPARRDALVTAALLAIQGGLVHALVISPFIAAFHPVNALLVFWWAVGTARRAA